MGRSNSDERYIIDICDKVLGRKASQQHRFYFLRGDSKLPDSTGRRLPVDAYYDDLKLVIEYYEKQHSESVPFMDKKMTVSGVSRGEQRKVYDKRRKTELPRQGIELVILDCSDFSVGQSKRLRRDPKIDESVIRKKLSKFMVNP